MDINELRNRLRAIELELNAFEHRPFADVRAKARMLFNMRNASQALQREALASSETNMNDMAAASGLCRRILRHAAQLSRSEASDGSQPLSVSEFLLRAQA